MNKAKRKKKTVSKRESPGSTRAQSVVVSLYPLLDDNNTQKATLTYEELCQVNRCLATRARHCVFVRPDVTYRFTGSGPDMARFKRLVRRFLIDARIFTEAEAAASTFFELVGHLIPRIEREQERINAKWTNGLRNIWRMAVKHKGRWKEKASQLVEILETGEPGEAPIPYNESGDRLPSGDDLAWLYWVLSEVLETVYEVKDVLIARGDKDRLRRDFASIAREIDEHVWWHITVKDCETYWSLIAADLGVSDERSSQLRDPYAGPHGIRYRSPWWERASRATEINGSQQAIKCGPSGSGERKTETDSQTSKIFDDDTQLAPAEIARRLRLKPATVRKRLERRRNRDDNCYVEVQTRKKNEPQFLYYWGKVKDLFPH